VVDEDGKLKPAFLAVTNMQAEKPEIIARNSERVLTARLRDARFFWDEDRKRRSNRASSACPRSCFTRSSAAIARRRIASPRSPSGSRATRFRGGCGGAAERAGRLAKADLATDMVREFTELQGTMGGIYAREEGQPEAVWKAIYYHYLPSAWRRTPRRRASSLALDVARASAAVTWAAVSLADKLDSVAGMFAPASGRPGRATRSACDARRRGP